MGQQVRDDQLGIAGIGADVHFCPRAVLQRHHAPQLQGNGHPLVLAQSAVVMGLEISHFALLIEGIGLEVQTGRVDVGRGDLNALVQRRTADVGQHDRLAPVAHIHLVAGLELHTRGKGTVSLLLCQAHALRRAQPLGLSGIQIRHIIPAVGLHMLQCRRIQTVIAVFPVGQQLLFQFLDLRLVHVPFPPSRSLPTAQKIPGPPAGRPPPSPRRC